MSGPWEDYQPTAKEQGPWNDYGTSKENVSVAFSPSTATDEELRQAAIGGQRPAMEEFHKRHVTAGEEIDPSTLGSALQKAGAGVVQGVASIPGGIYGMAKQAVDPALAVGRGLSRLYSGQSTVKQELGNIPDYIKEHGSEVAESLKSPISRDLPQFVYGTPREAGQVAGQYGGMMAAPEIARAGLKAAAPVAQKISARLAKSAASDYTDVLAPTTKPLKQITAEKVVPGMMERRMIATSREALQRQAEQGVEEAGQALDVGYQAKPKGTQSAFKPVLQNLEQLKKDQIVNGVVIDKGKFKALQEMQNDLRNVAGGTTSASQRVPTVDLEDAVKVRQILDRAVAAKKQTFGITGKEGDQLWAKNQTSNMIRSNLADEHPDIAQLNKDFNFWKNLETVIGETNLRKSSQQKTPLPQKVVTAGALAKGGIKFAVVMHYLQKATNSPLWKTVSAAQKSRLADFLADGNYSGAKQLISNISTSGSALQPTAPTGAQLPPIGGAAPSPRGAQLPPIGRFTTLPTTTPVAPRATPGMASPTMFPGQRIVRGTGASITPPTTQAGVIPFENLPDYAKRSAAYTEMGRKTNYGKESNLIGSSWENVTVPIDSLRKGNEMLWKGTGSTFEHRGSKTTGPIVLDRSGEIIDGNNRLYEALQRGEKEISVLRPVSHP